MILLAFQHDMKLRVGACLSNDPGVWGIKLIVGRDVEVRVSSPTSSVGRSVAIRGPLGDHILGKPGTGDDRRGCSRQANEHCQAMYDELEFHNDKLNK